MAGCWWVLITSLEVGLLAAMNEDQHIRANGGELCLFRLLLHFYGFNGSNENRPYLSAHMDSRRWEPGQSQWQSIIITASSGPKALIKWPISSVTMNEPKSGPEYCVALVKAGAKVLIKM